MGKQYLAANAAVDHDFDLRSNAGRKDLMDQVANEIDEAIYCLLEEELNGFAGDDDWPAASWYDVELARFAGLG